MEDCYVILNHVVSGDGKKRHFPAFIQ